MPSGEVRMTSDGEEPMVEPTAANCVPDHATLFKTQGRPPKLIPLKSCLVQVIPSLEVSAVPELAPTATNLAPDQATLRRLSAVPDDREVHVTPSGEVRTVPASPTATNCVPDHITPFRLFPVPEVCEVTGMPVTVIGAYVRPMMVRFEDGSALAMPVDASMPTTTRRLPAVMLPGGMLKDVVFIVVSSKK